MILPLLFVPLVYGLSSTPDACAAPSRVPGTYECGPAPYPAPGWKKCCWTETDPEDPEGIELYYCHICAPSGRCGEKFPGSSAPPPTFDPAAPLQEGVLEQLPDQPPLFGRNEGAVPLTGGIEQPFTTTTPPLFGNIPQGGGFGVLQEPETPPTFGQVAPLVQKPTTETPMTPLPTPTPPPPDFAPQDNQDNGGLPTLENQEDVPPGGGAAEQPQDDGQEDSSEGAETAGPLT